MKQATSQILVMDPDPQTRLFLQRYVEVCFGFQSAAACDFSDALEALEGRSFNLIFLDAGSGRGGEVLDWLRAVGRKDPVVMTSSGVGWDLFEEYSQRGARDLVAKPFQPSILSRVIASITGREPFNPFTQAPTPWRSEATTAARAAGEALDGLLDSIGEIHECIVSLDRGIGRSSAERGLSGLEEEVAEAAKCVEATFQDLASLRRRVHTLKFGRAYQAPGMLLLPRTPRHEF